MYSNELVCDILKYIDKNIHTDISIDLISSIFCYDKFYIMKRFKKELGITIFNYINILKIYSSLKYFKEDYSMLKIALNSNFNSLEYYSETFKKVIGVSPFCYKKFVRYDLRISQNEIDTIINSLVYINTLLNNIDSYKNNGKPKNNKLIKQLSVYK